MNFIFRLFITFSALSLFVVIFLVNQKIIMIPVLEECNYILYVIIPFILTYFSIRLSKKLGCDNLGDINFIETSNNDFLSNYLAFFFVALSIEDWLIFCVCFGLTALFTFYSRVSYFNPILLVFGYKFYYVHLESKSKIMLITKENIKSASLINKDKKYNRINDFTFIG